MKTILLFIIILSITIVNATTFYAGEEIIIPIDYEIVNCSVTNSTYNLDGLNLSWYDSNIVIYTVPNYKPDNLTISCLVIKYKEVVEEHYSSSSGGGSCRIKKDFDWNCSEWSECVNETQSRLCKEKNNCHNTYGKPNEVRNCSITNQTEIIDIEPIEEPKIKWYVRLWNWIKNFFK